MAYTGYTPKHFRIEELVWPEFFRLHQARGADMLMAFDERALITLDRLRERYGPVTVNNWADCRDPRNARTMSGLRPLGGPVGAALSQHCFGRAFDCVFVRVTADQVRADMEEAGGFMPGGALRPGPFEFITRIEEFPGMSWFHFDTGPHDVARLGVKVVGRA